MCTERVIGPDARVEVRGPDVPAASSAQPAAPQTLSARMTFDQFVIGEGNRLAHAAALAVAEMPGMAYNPLFICGPPGLGKTHLLQSIANYVTQYGGGLTALYTTVETFTDRFLGALHGGGMGGFKAAYRGVDVLLVDDVQFLQRKVRTEEEFFHTFNDLQQAGAQLVLTSDRLPRDMEELEDRLRDRFEAGLVCDVQPADRATRLTILRKRVAQDDLVAVDPAALELIADRVDTNIRALEGALIRVAAFSSLTARPVTGELAAEVLDGLYPELTPRRRTVEEIQRADLRGLRRDAGRAPLAQPYTARRVRPPDGHVPRARAHRRHAAGDRARVRQPQPHHGPARLPPGRRAHRRRRGRLQRRAASDRDAGRTLMASGRPDRLREFIHSPCAPPNPLGSARRATCAHDQHPL